MFRSIFLITVMIWMLELALHFGGNVFYLLLVVAAIVLLMNYKFSAALSINTGLAI
jgi:hypothetical protein